MEASLRKILLVVIENFIKKESRKMKNSKVARGAWINNSRLNLLELLLLESESAELVLEEHFL
jgi:hypothetical protein